MYQTRELFLCNKPIVLVATIWHWYNNVYFWSKSMAFIWFSNHQYAIMISMMAWTINSFLLCIWGKVPSSQNLCFDQQLSKICSDRNSNNTCSHAVWPCSVASFPADGERLQGYFSQIKWPTNLCKVDEGCANSDCTFLQRL